MPRRISWHWYEPETPKCEFCLDRDVQWLYRTKPFELPRDGALPRYIDDGEWVACDHCKKLIEAGDWEQLLTVSVRCQAAEHAKDPTRPPFDLLLSIAWRRRMHAAFQENLISGPELERDPRS